MLENLQQHLEHLIVGPAVTHENLTVYPLFAPPTGPKVVTLLEALKAETAEVCEVSEGGSVPELLVKNNGGLPLLILDGEELVGAKQNRILNTSILVKAGAFVKVPVSCVERGRWSRVSRQFASHERIMPSSMRSMKSARVSASLKRARGYDADQTSVWNEVAEYSRSRGVRSATGALTDILAADAVHVDDYVNAIAAQEGQVGLAAYADGRFLGLDLVARPEVYASAHKRLLRCYGAEAVVTNARTQRRPLPGRSRRRRRSSEAGRWEQSFESYDEPRTIAITLDQLNLELGDEFSVGLADQPSERVSRQKRRPVAADPAADTKPESPSDPLALLAETLRGELSTHASPGSGTDLRMEAAHSQLSALWADGAIAHLTAFPVA